MYLLTCESMYAVCKRTYCMYPRIRVSFISTSVYLFVEVFMYWLIYVILSGYPRIWASVYPCVCVSAHLFSRIFVFQWGSCLYVCTVLYCTVCWSARVKLLMVGGTQIFKLPTVPVYNKRRVGPSPAPPPFHFNSGVYTYVRRGVNYVSN
jgi:hypothetical protein